MNCQLCDDEVEDLIPCEVCGKKVCISCIHRQQTEPDEWIDVCDQCEADKYEGR